MKSFDKVVYSQSAMHCRIRSLSPNIEVNKEKILSQSEKHIKDNMIRIIVIEGKAYWVAENIFYVAEMEKGNIISESVKQIDTSKMSKDDIDKMLFILDNLNGGGEKNDSSSSRNH